MPTPTKRTALQHANPVKRPDIDDVIVAPSSGADASGYDASFTSRPASDENDALLLQSKRSARQHVHHVKHQRSDDGTVTPSSVAGLLQPAVVTPIACVHGASVAELCSRPDIWETICGWLSGDALSCAAQVSKAFRCATRATPAFVLLAGINNDAEVVPWGSPDNVLSSQYAHHINNRDREIDASAIQASQQTLRDVASPDYMQHKRQRLHGAYVRSGPARPPSPEHAGAAIATFDPYVRPDGYRVTRRLNPPVFGVRAGFSYAPFWDVLVHSSDCSDGEYDWVYM